MGGSRQTFSLWFWLKRNPKEFIKRKMWKCEYFWHDTLWIYLNRLVGCRLLGHRKVQLISGENGKGVLFCFNCHREVGNGKPNKGH